jgi:hypothetical protein
MAFTKIELAEYTQALNAWMENRPPLHIRPKLDFGYRIKGQSVELFEIQPAFQKPKQKTELPFAKATWNKRRALWQIYWMMGNLKWHRYEPYNSAVTLERFLRVVREDKHACFFG